MRLQHGPLSMLPRTRDAPRAAFRRQPHLYHDAIGAGRSGKFHGQKPLLDQIGS